MTEDFHESDWTDQEVGFAVGRSIPVISVNLGRTPYGFLGRIQAPTSTWQTAALDIVKILISRGSMFDAYVQAIRSGPHPSDPSEHLAPLQRLAPQVRAVKFDQVERAQRHEAIMAAAAQQIEEASPSVSKAMASPSTRQERTRNASTAV